MVIVIKADGSMGFFEGSPTDPDTEFRKIFEDEDA